MRGDGGVEKWVSRLEGRVEDRIRIRHGRVDLSFLGCPSVVIRRLEDEERAESGVCRKCPGAGWDDSSSRKVLWDRQLLCNRCMRRRGIAYGIGSCCAIAACVEGESLVG